ncbi:hypothetical protein A2801_03500 [Candidatus Woesebacteria bacterium RIFCSPHIGHO2_01_FULL_41_10]|uniref:Uncharacterized protein n=1 Tax=Candidatus Woesebacteria bacterium RIFCSPHIGHO2_01_FULL_41_10 TaxID=1802500 RepID=A0A1F7YN79_9BACT|nr:MAG: hypothetical protein A2801_03500 [Candidatus Woesebacteria bacterium RIFCSPHIGHO2_01_FULL_41_10]
MEETPPQSKDSQTTPEPSDDLTTLVGVENAVKTHMRRIEELKNELKPQKEMLDSVLLGDPEYVEKNEAAKKASKAKNERKRALLNEPHAKELAQKVTELKDELRDSQEALSYYLREYQQQTGANEFEGEDGELRDIVLVAKLVRKTNLNR